jgi:hypothetical protein
VFIGKKNGVSRYVTLDGLIPSTDLQRLSGLQGFKEMLGMVSPILKEPAEQILNKNFYTGSALQRYEGQKTDFVNTQLPVRLEHLLNLFRPIAELEKVIGRKAKGEDMSNRILRAVIGLNVKDIDANTQVQKMMRESDQDARNILINISYDNCPYFGLYYHKVYFKRR